jgi:uncharacterized protein YegP (UPF0339 family)
VKLDIYEDAAGEWRWRIVARNGRIVADSGEGYATKSNAKRAAERLRGAIVRYQVKWS